MFLATRFVKIRRFIEKHAEDPNENRIERKFPLDSENVTKLVHFRRFLIQVKATIRIVSRSYD